MQYGKILAIAFAAAALVAVNASARAEGDAKAGAKVFKQHLCFGCHSFKAGRNGAGPSLHGVFGRKAAQAPGFDYSDALKNSGITWTPDELNKWVQGPQKLVPGVKMVLVKPVTNATDRENLIAYIKEESSK